MLREQQVSFDMGLGEEGPAASHDLDAPDAVGDVVEVVNAVVNVRLVVDDVLGGVVRNQLSTAGLKSGSDSLTHKKDYKFA